MKVIKDNHNNPSWRITCSHCNSILEYTREDVVEKEETVYGRTLYRYYIYCPCCNGIIDVFEH